LRIVDVDQLGPRSLRRLLDAVLGIGAELDLDQALRHIVEAAVALVDARYGALGVLDESKSQLAEFITVGLDDETRRAIGDPPKGLGLLGALITDAHALRVPVIAEHPRRAGFPPGHPPMTSFLGVPIVSHGEVYGNLYLTDKTTAEVFTDLDEQLVSGLAAAAGVVIDNARLYGRVQRRDATLTAVHDIVAAVAAEREGHHAMQLVADRAQTLVDADVATIALPAGPDELSIDIAAGAVADELRGRRFPVADSVSGEVMRSGRPVVVADASQDGRLGQPQVSGGVIGPAVWIPLAANGRPAGSLCLARTRGAAPFSQSEIDLALLFAAHAGVILEVDQGRDDAERVSVLHDQERIARDLHDTVIQRLFATGLSLQAVARLTDEPARSRVMNAVDDLDDTIRQIRTVIFGLERPSASAPVSLRARLLEVCAEVARPLGFDPAIRFEGAIDVGVGPNDIADIVPVVREALSNVARHAGATHVDVDVGIGDGRLRVVVSDDGRGFDPEVSPGGHGVQNMRARAARRGGSFELDERPGGGTTLRWSVPLAD
jgi:signal transduction histidine kinase